MSETGNPITAAAAEQSPPQPPATPPAGAQALAMPGASQAGDVLKYMKAQMDQTAARVDKIQQAKGRATVIRRALDQLAAMGDTVTQEDVTKESSKLVAAGMSPEEVAGILADMPQGGEALQGWVAMHDQTLRQNEAQIDTLLNQQRHVLGVQALHHIGAVSMVNHGLRNAPLAAAAPQTNPLTGGAPSNG